MPLVRAALWALRSLGAGNVRVTMGATHVSLFLASVPEASSHLT